MVSAGSSERPTREWAAVNLQLLKQMGSSYTLPRPTIRLRIIGIGNSTDRERKRLCSPIADHVERKRTAGFGFRVHRDGPVAGNDHKSPFDFCVWVPPAGHSRQE